MKTDMLRLRPHHALCLQGFVGKGYSDGFTANMRRIADRLAADPEQTVRLTDGPDDLCAPCPHRVGDGCESDGFVCRVDAAVRNACGRQAGQIVRWADFRAQAEEMIFASGRLEEICADCEWLALCREQARLRRREDR